MRRRAFTAFIIACAAVMFVSANAIAGAVMRGWRLDLTEQRLYSLSPEAAAVIDDLSEPVDLTFFYSRKLAQDFPRIRAYGARVRETLQAYAARAGGRIRLEIVDPRPYTDAEDRALRAGLEGLPVGEDEALFFGLAARNSVDDRAIIPFFNPDREPFLEYELSRVFVEMETPSRARVALITGLPMETAPAPGRAPTGIHAYRQLIDAFDVELLDPDWTALPADADLLVVAHPPPLGPHQLYAIDQFVLRGGRALVFVDPLSELATSPGPTGLPNFDASPRSDAAPLLASWGVVYDAGTVVLDLENALRAQFDDGGRQVERPYPLWFRIPPENLDSDELATASLRRGINFVGAGGLSRRQDAATRFTALAWTSDASATMDAREAQLENPVNLFARARSDGVSRTVIARVRGEARSAFPDGAPDVDDVFDLPTPAEHLDSGEIDVIVAADSDLFNDRFYVSGDPSLGETTTADNAAFILNAVDLFSGSDALVGLRARAPSDRPMTLIENLRAEAEARLAAEEGRLTLEVAEAEARLRELEAAGEGSGFFSGDLDADLTEAELGEVQRFRNVIVDTRGRLREVKRTFLSDVDRLEALLTFLNVWLMALLAAGAGVWTFFARRRGRASP